MTEALRTHEHAVIALKAAQGCGFQLTPNGNRIQVDKTACSNKEQADTVMAILRHNKQQIEALTSDQAAVKQMLLEARSALVEADRYVHEYMDRWYDLEGVYRKLWPNDKACITDDGQCGDSRTIVRCQTCEEKHDL